MGTFDLHIHTFYSPCSNLTPLTVLQTAEATGLSAIAITDHNTTTGARVARTLWAEHPTKFSGLQLYMGIECKTKYGELNAIFLGWDECDAFDRMERDDRGRLDLAEIVREVAKMKEAGKDIMVGLNHCVSRSFFNKRGGFDFEGAIRDGVFDSMRSLMLFFDYVELNAMNLKQEESDAALELAKKYGRPVVCNTDSHWKRFLGRYFTTGNRETPRDCILAAQEGDMDALKLPDKISYRWNIYYRLKCASLREIRRATKRLHG